MLLTRLQTPQRALSLAAVQLEVQSHLPSCRFLCMAVLLAVAPGATLPLLKPWRPAVYMIMLKRFCAPSLLLGGRHSEYQSEQLAEA